MEGKVSGTASDAYVMILRRLPRAELARLRSHAEDYARRLSTAKVSLAQTSGLVRVLLRASSPSEIRAFFEGIRQRAGHLPGGWNSPTDEDKPLWQTLVEYLTETLTRRASEIVEQARVSVQMPAEAPPPNEVNEVWQRVIQEFGSYLSGWSRIIWSK